jgi:hypothetical protein
MRGRRTGASATSSRSTSTPPASAAITPLIARLEAQLDKLDDAERPSPVMVWTPEQTGEFLDGIENDRLYPLYHLIAYRGTRRGETCGARWVDLNKAASSLKVSEQLVQLGWKLRQANP